MTATATPVTVRRQVTMTRIREAEAVLRYQAARRAAARKAGYRGPLTRAELASQAGSQA